MKKGIDVSHWNGEINWKEVAKDNIKFAFAKATEGETFQDSHFQKNFQEMKANEIKAGAFHVFRMTSTPEGQAKNITDTLSEANFNSETDKLAVSATTGICSTGREKCDDPTKHTNQERAENLNSLLTKLSEEGYNPIIYASPLTWNKYYIQEEHDFSQYPLWVADWRGREAPEMPKDWKDAEKSYDYWNYTDKGAVKGIEGNVDLDQTSQDMWSA